MIPNKPIRQPNQVAKTIVVLTVGSMILGSGIYLFLHFRNSGLKELNSEMQSSSGTAEHAHAIDSSDFVLSERNADADPDFKDLLLPHAFTDRITDPVFPAGVHPPFPTINTELQKSVVNANVGQILTTKHNSSIQIPPRAFLDKNGKIVEGDVDVKFREYYNYLDIFLSGIPMNYLDGDSAQLESAGMIELTATKNNERLYVNPASKINVMLASMKDSKDFNLYYFDSSKNKWVNKGKDNVITQQDGRSSWQQMNKLRDSTEKKFAFNANKYPTRLICSEYPVAKRNFFWEKKKEPDHFVFRITSLNKSVPELKLIGSTSWAYLGEDAKEIHQKLFYKPVNDSVKRLQPRTWNNFSIEETPEPDLFRLTLYDEQSSVSINIVPKFPTEVNRKRFKSKIGAFQSMQKDRYEGDRIAFEKFKQDTTKYFAENGRYTVTSVSTSSYVVRQFQIDGFGIWNCDRPLSMPKGRTVYAQFVDQDGKKLELAAVYLADKTKNTVYTYSYQGQKNFRFDPTSKNLVWAVLPDGRLAVIKPDEFKEKYSNARSNCVFKFAVSKNAISTKDNLKEKLSFDS